MPHTGQENPPDLSVIVPLFNEEDNVRPLYEALSRVMQDQGLHYELVFVDDGSRDRTFANARDIALQDRRLRVIQFRRNYGQTPAMAAGIDHVRGRILITMDGDLQNDPADIPKLLQKIEDGYDIAVGWRMKRKEKFLTRRLPSMVANRIIGWVTGVPIRDNGCSLKAYRASIIKQVPLYSEMHRFIPAVSSVAGPQIVEVGVNDRKRLHGHSKYGLSRIYKVILDLITIKTLLNLIRHPMRLFGGSAGIAMALALLILFLETHTALSTGAFSLMQMSMALLFATLGIFLIFLGALCELIYRTGNFKLDDLSLLTATVDGVVPELAIDRPGDQSDDCASGPTSMGFCKDKAAL